MFDYAENSWIFTFFKVVGTGFVDSIGGSPTSCRWKPQIGLQILGRSKEANAIDTQDDNFKSSLSNISLKPIRNWTEIQ